MDSELIEIEIAFAHGPEKRMVKPVSAGWSIFETMGGYTVTSVYSGRKISGTFSLEKYAHGCAVSLAREVQAETLDAILKRTHNGQSMTHDEYELMDVVNTILNEWRLLELENAINGVDE